MKAYRKLYQLYRDGSLPVALANGWRDFHGRVESPLKEFSYMQGAARKSALLLMLYFSMAVFRDTAMLAGPETVWLRFVVLVHPAVRWVLIATIVLAGIWILDNSKRHGVRSFVKALIELEAAMEMPSEEMACLGPKDLSRIAEAALIRAAMAVNQADAIGPSSNSQLVRVRFTEKFELFKKFNIISHSADWEPYFRAARRGDRTLEAVAT